MQKHTFVQVGLGPLGLKMIAMAAKRSSCQLVAAVDTNPELVGKDVGEIAGVAGTGIVVQDSIEAVLQSMRPDIAVVTTVSDMQRITPLLVSLSRRGIPVVSTCEELSYAWDEAPDQAREVDSAAMQHGVAVLGTGVNPGFLMDSLPSFLTAVSESVDKVEVARYQDAQYRRIPFQRKIGAGLTMEEFESKKQTGTLRHVGLTESMQFIAKALGWRLESTEDNLSPVVAEEVIETPALTIAAGDAMGVRQVGIGKVAGEEKIRLVFQAAVGEPESYDEIRITGTPNITSRIAGGVNGDIATCAITLNAIPSVLNARPGLRTMANVPLITCQP